MTEKDELAFSTLMLGMMEYYQREPSDSVVSIYWHGLKGYDLQAVQDAMYRHMQNPESGQFMPKIADIAKMATGSSQDKSYLAWTKVDKAIRQIGTYQDVVFDDPIIHRVISDMGGWILVGSKDDNEWPFIAREFENRYKGYASRSEFPTYQKQLTGIANAENGRNGKRLNPPVMVGDSRKAMLTYQGGSNEQSGFKKLESSSDKG